MRSASTRPRLPTSPAQRSGSHFRDHAPQVRTSTPWVDPSTVNELAAEYEEVEYQPKPILKKQRSPVAEEAHSIQFIMQSYRGGPLDQEEFKENAIVKQAPQLQDEEEKKMHAETNCEKKEAKRNFTTHTNMNSNVGFQDKPNVYEATKQVGIGTFVRQKRAADGIHALTNNAAI